MSANSWSCLLRPMFKLGHEHSISRCLPIQNLLSFGHLGEWVIHVLTKGYFPVLQNLLLYWIFYFSNSEQHKKKERSFLFSALWCFFYFANGLDHFSAPLELSLVDLSRHHFGVHCRKTTNQPKKSTRPNTHISSAAIIIGMKLLTSVVSGFMYFA